MKNRTKYILALLIFTCLLLIETNAQVSINESGDNPDASAMLDVSSSDKGLLIPRMDSTARQNIVSPAEGLMVFDSTTNSFWYYITNWIEIGRSTLLVDQDGDTQILVEESEDEDIIRFDLAGTEFLRLDSGRIEILNTGRSIIIGEEAGQHDNFNNNANIFIGNRAGYSTDEGDQNIAIGHSALENAAGSNSDRNIAIGATTLQALIDGNNNVAVGEDALRDLEDGEGNVAIGQDALLRADTANYNVAVGDDAGESNTGDNNVFIGQSSGQASGGGSSNVFIGAEAGIAMTGDSSVIIGPYVGGSISNSESNLLMIDNTSVGDPLIYGKFDKDSLQINGTLNINGAFAFPIVDGNENQILVTDGSGTLDWATNNGAFNSENGITAAINNEDDFIFGADSLNYGTGTETKFFFDKDKGAFRAGTITNSVDWNQDSVGQYSIALGLSTRASGGNSTAFGNRAVASGEIATAFGSSAKATGDFSTAFGVQVTASGKWSTAFGYFSEATNEYATAFGFATNATGGQSTAFGRSTNASGSFSTAFGRGTSAGGSYATAFGRSTNASGDYSTAFGQTVNAVSFAEVAIGHFNTDYTANDTFAINSDDRLFVIGNGIDDNNPSDALRIYKNGNTELNGALTIDSSYTFPITDGTTGQFLQTDGDGNINWADQETFTDTDDQTIDVLNLNGSTLEISLENDGENTKELELSGIESHLFQYETCTETSIIEQSASQSSVLSFTGWQSWTSTVNGRLSSITFGTDLLDAGTATLYEGEGITGNAILLAIVQMEDGGTVADFSTLDINLEADQQYTIRIDENTGFNFEWDCTTLDIYNGGITDQGSDKDYVFEVFVRGDCTESSIFEQDSNGDWNATFEGGNVGIGVTAPTERLEVDGTVSATTFVGDGSGLTNAGTDDQTVDKFELSGSNLLISLEGDGQNDYTVDLTAIDTDTDTDDQTIDKLSLNGTLFTISLEDDGESDQTLNLAPIQDDLGDHSATQNIELSNNWLSNDGGGEGIRIDNDGNVGIGTSSPAALLDLSDGSGDDAVLLRFNTERSWQFEQTGTGSNNTLFLQSSSSGKNFNILSDDGTPIASFRSNGSNSNRVGINTTVSTSGEALEVNGGASKTVPGSWSGNSDKRLKKNIEPLHPQQTLNKLLSLQGVTYEWNDNETGFDRPEGIQYGFTAQNIQTIFPSLVSEDGNGFLQTAYGTYDAMYVEALRALSIENDELKMENAELESRVEKLEASVAKINQLEAMLTQLQAQINQDSSNKLSTPSTKK